jgi:hypothetical protein
LARAGALKLEIIKDARDILQFGVMEESPARGQTHGRSIGAMTQANDTFDLNIDAAI